MTHTTLLLTAILALFAATAYAQDQPGHGDHAGHAEHTGHEGHAGHGEHAGHEGHGHQVIQGSGAMMGTLLEEGSYDPETVVENGQAAEGDITTCPVDGRVFMVVDDSPYVETEAGDIYYCCTHCLRAAPPTY